MCTMALSEDNGCFDALPEHPGSAVCQVPACMTDLSCSKPYYQRRRICRPHHSSAAVMFNGVPSRFCQQCGVLHGITAFTGLHRSCKASLSRRSARRQGMANVSATSRGGFHHGWTSAANHPQIHSSSTSHAAEATCNPAAPTASSLSVLMNGCTGSDSYIHPLMVHVGHFCCISCLHM
jgi:hypothetical protein